MPERNPSGRRTTFRLLAVDAWIDTTAWRIASGLAGGWTLVADRMSRLRVRGVKRAMAEVASEAATLGAAGSVVLLALAVPAFKATETDWRAKGEYAVTFLDRNGTLIGRRGMFLDDTVPLDDLPKSLIQATLATEDRRFFEHFGIDVIGTLRALVENTRAGGVRQGGSSISQQLAKNLFLSNERTIERKIREAYLALWLEANLTKREILKLYLDRAYMGGGAHGVAAASQFYFGKSVKDLTFAESAMLAGLYKAPTRYAPHINMAAARARANQVLTNMVDAGFVTEGQVAAARRNPATSVVQARDPAPDWFLDWAFEEVKRIAPQGDRTITVRTTLDRRLQAAADAAIESNLRQHGKDYRVTQAATVVQETGGAVRAMVGGRDYGESQFNRASGAVRQPGSSFKPFVYATAMMNGYSMDSIVADAPISIGNWSPRNYGRSYAGNVTLKTALAKSINTIPVRLAQAIGRDKIVETAHALGIRTELKITRPLPLGVAEVTALDMAGAYSAFPNRGLKATPYAVETIATRSGSVIYDRARDEPPPARVLPEAVAEEMNRGLLAAVEAGTGGRARIPGHMVAGKTGTTQAYRDAWFVGYTAYFTGSVWYGNDDFTSTANMTGGSLPAMTWQQIMATAHEGLPLKVLPGLGEAPAAVAEADVPDVSGPAAADRETLSVEALGVVGTIGRLMQIRLDGSDIPTASVLPTRPTILEIGAPPPGASSSIRLNGVTVAAGAETGSTAAVQ